MALLKEYANRQRQQQAAQQIERQQAQGVDVDADKEKQQQAQGRDATEGWKEGQEAPLEQAGGRVKVCAIAAGGDGTVKWVMHELEKAGLKGEWNPPALR